MSPAASCELLRTNVTMVAAARDVLVIVISPVSLFSVTAEDLFPDCATVPPAPLEYPNALVSVRTPFAPAGPVAPVAPCGPVAPLGPSAPVAPVAPVEPCGPGSPCAPWGPVGPWMPWSPFGPVGPAGPV